MCFIPLFFPRFCFFTLLNAYCNTISPCFYLYPWIHHNTLMQLHRTICLHHCRSHINSCLGNLGMSFITLSSFLFTTCQHLNRWRFWNQIHPKHCFCLPYSEKPWCKVKSMARWTATKEPPPAVFKAPPSVLIVMVTSKRWQVSGAPPMRYLCEMGGAIKPGWMLGGHCHGNSLQGQQPCHIRRIVFFLILISYWPIKEA